MFLHAAPPPPVRLLPAGAGAGAARLRRLLRRGRRGRRGWRRARVLHLPEQGGCREQNAACRHPLPPRLPSRLPGAMADCQGRLPHVPAPAAAAVSGAAWPPDTPAAAAVSRIAQAAPLRDGYSSGSQIGRRHLSANPSSAGSSVLPVCCRPANAFILHTKSIGPQNCSRPPCPHPPLLYSPPPSPPSLSPRMPPPTFARASAPRTNPHRFVSTACIRCCPPVLPRCHAHCPPVLLLSVWLPASVTTQSRAAISHAVISAHCRQTQQTGCHQAQGRRRQLPWPACF